MIRYQEKEAKSILNKMKVIDSWFWCRYTTNPYNGCEHACIYCDARSERYYLQADFDETIFVKINAPQLLENQLKNSRSMLPDVVAMAGTCDAYQPAEAQYKITQKMLQILLKYHYPLTLSTKSILVKRDVELFEAIALDTWCSIAFTVTSCDPSIVKFLEPRTATSQERFEAIRFFKENAPHVKVGVNFMPIVPLLEDSDENLENVIRNASEVNADYVLFAPGVTLRDKQADFFLSRLQQTYPQIYPEFSKRFGPRSPPNSQYYTNMQRKLMKLCEHYHLAVHVPRWITNDFRKVNYQIAQILLNEFEMQKRLGQPADQLFWIAQNIQNLEESILDLNRRNELKTIRGMTDQMIEKISPYLIDSRPSLDKFLNKR